MCQSGGAPDPSQSPMAQPQPAAPAAPAPQNPANAMTAAQKVKKLGQGFMAGQAGAQAFQPPQQPGGGPSPIQMMSSPAAGGSLGPLGDSILQKYLQGMGGGQ